MFSEIIKLLPQIDKQSLNTMFKTLNDRFAQVAKKFGAGMKSALKMGPAMAIAGAFLAKLLNPLQRAEEIIDKITGKGDDAVTNADEFASDAGKLLRLEAIGAAKGLEPETLRTLLGKFQSALADEQQAAKDPNKQPGILREFVSETDTAEAFFKFIQSIQTLEKSRQVQVQGEIFGEKIRGRASEFFNAKDFGDILKMLPSSEKLSKAAERAGGFADTKDLQAAIRNAEDFVKKSQLINGGMINDIDTSERQKNRADDETLKRYDALKSTSIAVQELTHKFDKFTTDMMNDVAPKLVDILKELTAGVNILIPYMKSLVDWTAGAFDSTVEAIAGVSVAIEGYWGEFKNSRLYKYFGGGK